MTYTVSSGTLNPSIPLLTYLLTAKAADDDGDVYYSREFNDVGICIIGLVHYMLLKLKKKNAWHLWRKF